MSSYGRVCASFAAQVLVVEQRVGDAGIWLVHPHDVAAGRKVALHRCRLLTRWRGPLRGRRLRRRRSPGGSRCRISAPLSPSPAAPAAGRRRPRRHRDGERRGRPRDLNALPLQHAQQFGLRAEARVARRQHVGRRALDLRFHHRALALVVEVAEEVDAVVGEVVERDDDARLLVVVVVPERPHHAADRRVLPEPGPRRLAGRQRPILGVGVAAVAERLVEATDAVVQRREEHQVAGRPGVERAPRVDAGHAHPRHLVHVVPPDQMPLVGEDRVEPRVVGAVAHGVVVEERARLVEVVQHLRLPPDEGVEDGPRHGERQAHCVAVVVVPHVLPGIDRAHRRVVRVLLLPLVHVHHVVAAVRLGDRRDERDDVLADVADVRAVVNGQAVGQFHQRRRRTGLAGVDGPVDVVDRRDALGDRVGHRVVHLDRARIGQFREIRLVLIELGHQGFRRDGDDDHLAAVLCRPDGVDLHARRGLGEEAHVVVHLLRIRQLARRAGDVAEDRLRRRDGLGRGHVVDDGRQEEGLGGVLLDLLRVLLVDRLGGQAARLGRGQRGAPGRG